MNISGRLTADAKVSTTPTGREVVNFSIAVNDSYKNKDGERIDQTAFIDCAYWRTAKAVSWLSKGLYVELTGQISVRAWIDKHGNPKAGMNFHTATIKPVSASAKKDDDAIQQSPKKKKSKAVQTADDDDLPF